MTERTGTHSGSWHPWARFLICILPLIAGFLPCHRAMASTTTGVTDVNSRIPLDGTPVSDWYAVTESGTFLVSGHRIVLMRGINLPQELGALALRTLAGAAWKQAWLLLYALYLKPLWPQLPEPVQFTLRGASQGWLLWTLARSLLTTSGSVFDLGHAWSKLSLGQKQLHAVLPIAVNDALLSFRFFFQVNFSEQPNDPVSLTIDRVPERLAQAQLHHIPYSYSPLEELDQHMGDSGIDRLQLSFSKPERLHMSFRTRQGNMQHLYVDLANLSAGTPWLLESIGQGQARTDTRLYTSMLSQQAIDLAGEMLACHRQHHQLPSDTTQCPGGQLVRRGHGFHYQPFTAVMLPRLWDKRDYEGGSVLPLSGCSQGGPPDCWEHYLVWSQGSALWPWPTLTFYSRFPGFDERNAWLLLRQEPQTWYTGSLLQTQVPETLSRSVLSLMAVASQTLANRAVLSLHNRILGETEYEGFPTAPLQESTAEPEGEKHTDTGPCPSCGFKPCLYQACSVGSCGRWRSDTLVDLGCSRGENKHLLCTDCFQGILNNTQMTPCSGCGRFHRSLIQTDYYQIDPDESQRGIPSAPMCPVCRTRFDSRRGTIGQFLGDECTTLGKRLGWLLRDGLGSGSPP
ncbi:MAG: hypothetical protein OXC07_07800 [Kistimonas sp.]|nr:hypothetical protein [Kistimonas sp.]